MIFCSLEFCSRPNALWLLLHVESLESRPHKGTDRTLTIIHWGNEDDFRTAADFYLMKWLRGWLSDTNGGHDANSLCVWIYRMDSPYGHKMPFEWLYWDPSHLLFVLLARIRFICIFCHCEIVSNHSECDDLECFVLKITATPNRALYMSLFSSSEVFYATYPIQFPS